jgi:hypothetical protein
MFKTSWESGVLIKFAEFYSLSFCNKELVSFGERRESLTAHHNSGKSSSVSHSNTIAN